MRRIKLETQKQLACLHVGSQNIGCVRVLALCNVIASVSCIASKCIASKSFSALRDLASRANEWSVDGFIPHRVYGTQTGNRCLLPYNRGDDNAKSALRHIAMVLSHNRGKEVGRPAPEACV